MSITISEYNEHNKRSGKYRAAGEFGHAVRQLSEAHHGEVAQVKTPAKVSILVRIFVCDHFGRAAGPHPKRE